MCENFVGLVTQQNVFYVVFAEVFFCSLYCRQYVEQVFFGFDFCFGVQAVVAVAAVFLVLLFAEIVQQQFTPAHGTFGVGCRLAQELAADILFGNGFAFH